MNIDSTMISTRIRLARNVEGLPFPHKMSELAAKKVIESVESVLVPIDRFRRIDMNKTSQLESTILMEKHLISSDLMSESKYGSVLISADENVSIMVNEEDHVREQVILSGLCLDQAYDRINNIDDILGKNIKFAFSPKYGYLTSCATNVGTGMRASVMMFLPALTLTKMMDSCINDVGRLNMTVRGVYGEGSRADGYLYQISNQRTLGLREGEILDSVKGAINHINEAELRARQLLKRNETDLKDRVYRAWGVATNAYCITTEEAMSLLAMVRLGAYYGYIQIKLPDEYDKLTTGCQPAGMQRLGGANMSVNERDILRARYIATNLQNIASINK